VIKNVYYEVNVPAIYLKLDELIFNANGIPSLIVKTDEGDKHLISNKDAYKLREMINKINLDKRDEFISLISKNDGFTYIIEILQGIDYEYIKQD
jgi:hypothetical protein